MSAYACLQSLLHDFCGKAPHRLKAALPVALDAVEEWRREIRRWGKEAVMVGILPQSRNDITRIIP